MLKHDLRNLISATGKSKQKSLITTISGYLAAGKTPGEEIKERKLTKQKETELISKYLDENNYKNILINENNFLTEGAEQKVYLNNDGTSVTKVNSSVFYFNWSDYLHSLLIHNFFFPQTSYTLSGFIKTNNSLYAVVQQPYIVTNEITDLDKVKSFMKSNGFKLKKNNDYYNESIGLITEDLHDENVLTKNKILFFIDTVFYVTNSFYQ